MPRVTRERTKYHHRHLGQTKKPSIGLPLVTPQTDSTVQNPGDIGKHVLMANQLDFGTSSKQNDIVSEKVLIEDKTMADDSAVCNAISTKALIREAPNKKSKRNLRHKLWLEKLSASKAAMKEEERRKSKKAQKSALMRGMDDMIDDIRNIANKGFSQNGATFGRKQDANENNRSNKGGIKSSKARNKIGKQEMKRFDTILQHSAYSADPLASIRQHIIKTQPKNP
ncbi:hypothetical protein H4219_005182 [Mycoemilia scoparia]|uniref:Ribosome biogenesis protein SLX9 n=1 Tax=Mycoemilia scoparia TaxID=417184 RepID=A0A9W7ZYK5_9FUNG|nr:hypothetical protein H4219_005182 [Mycoemilia scoparia]